MPRLQLSLQVRNLWTQWGCVMVCGASRAAIKHAAIKHKWSCKHAVMKQNKRALTTHKAGERLSEKRQELIDFRQSLGVPGIALQHRPTSWHVESGRIHRVHLSSVVLDRSSSGRKKKRKGATVQDFSPASSPRIINVDEPARAIPSCVKCKGDFNRYACLYIACIKTTPS